MSLIGDRIRIYELAKQLKQDVKSIIEEARRLGENVSLPSNSVSKETAEKILSLNFKIDKKEIAFGLHQSEKETLISLTTEKELPKFAVRLLGYKQKSSDLESKQLKTDENTETVIQENSAIEPKAENKANNSENQPRLNFKVLFETMGFYEIVSYIEKFLDDWEQSQFNRTNISHSKSRQMLAVLKRKANLDLSDTEAKSEIIKLLIQREKTIYNEKKKVYPPTKKRLVAITRVEDHKQLVINDETEKRIIINYKSKSYKEIQEFISNCLNELSKIQSGRKQFLQNEINDYKIPRKEETYEKLIELLKHRIPYKISNLAKFLQERSYKELTAQINLLEIRKRQIFFKLDNEKVNFFKSQVNLLNANNEPEHIENRVPIHTEKLSWTFLATGERGFEPIVKHFRNLISKGKWSGREVDETRLVMIESYLNPTHRYVGEKEFEGYVVYCFDQTEKKVILECPFYGNATYIIRGDWKEITKSSKWVAKYKHSNQVTVINHSKAWFERLRQNLNRSY